MCSGVLNNLDALPYSPCRILSTRLKGLQVREGVMRSIPVAKDLHGRSPVVSFSRNSAAARPLWSVAPFYYIFSEFGWQATMGTAAQFMQYNQQIMGPVWPGPFTP